MEPQEEDVYEDDLYLDHDREPEDEEEVDLAEFAYADGEAGALPPKPVIEKGAKIVEEEIYGHQVSDTVFEFLEGVGFQSHPPSLLRRVSIWNWRLI